MRHWAPCLILGISDVCPLGPESRAVIKSQSVSERKPRHLFASSHRIVAHLLQIDRRLPVVVAQLVKVSHTHFTEVTGMVFVDVCPVMMLTTGHTPTTWMLSVLSHSSMTCGDMTPAVKVVKISDGAQLA